MNEKSKGESLGVQNSQDATPDPPDDLPVPRLSNGRWVKGHGSANPTGKPKGSVTKKTERLKLLVQHAAADRFGEYLQALDFLRENDPKAFAVEYRFLLEFIMPKLQRSESTNLNVEVKEAQVIKIGETTFQIR